MGIRYRGIFEEYINNFKANMAGEVKLKFLTCLILSLFVQAIHSDVESCDAPSHLKITTEYIISSERMTWKESNAYCQGKEGKLVELLLPDFSKAALHCAKQLRKNNEPLWLGGTSTVGKFVYTQTNADTNFSIDDSSTNISCLMMNCSKSGNSYSCKYEYVSNCTEAAQEGYFICRKTGNATLTDGNIFVSDKSTGWYSARYKCGKKFGGSADLFYLTKSETLSTVSNKIGYLLISDRPYHIGVHRMQWKWNDSNNTIVSVKWMTNQPNETAPSCLVAKPGDVVDDVPCNHLYRAFCAKPKSQDSEEITFPSEETFPTTVTDKVTAQTSVLGIGIGVSVAVALLIVIIASILCYKRKSGKGPDSKTSRNASDQFHYLNSTLESQNPSIYANDPTAPQPIVENDIYKASSQYETIDNLNLGGSTGGSTGMSSRPGGDTNIPSPPDVTMRQKAQNQNGTSRNDVYSQVIKKKPSQKENQGNEYQNASVIQETSTDKKFDIANGINESDFDNDDHDIIDNEIYKFY